MPRKAEAANEPESEAVDVVDKRRFTVAAPLVGLEVGAEVGAGAAEDAAQLERWLASGALIESPTGDETKAD